MTTGSGGLVAFPTLHFALSDPGKVVARHEAEPLPAWQERAVIAVLTEHIKALPCGEHYVCKCAEYRDDRGFLLRRSAVLGVLA